MLPPTFKENDATSITSQWVVPEDMPVTGYTVRYRAEDEICWTPVNTVISRNISRKKNLRPGVVCYFAVKPEQSPAGSSETDGRWAFSQSPDPIGVAKLSTAVKNPATCGYTTVQGRSDWLTAHGVTKKEVFIKDFLDAIVKASVKTLIETKPLDTGLE